MGDQHVWRTALNGKNLRLEAPAAAKGLQILTQGLFDVDLVRVGGVDGIEANHLAEELFAGIGFFLAHVHVSPNVIQK